MKGAAAAGDASYRSWLARPRPVASRQSPILSGSHRWLRRVGDRYRHSLQLRVVTATLILSAVVVSVLGYILMQHLVAGIYANMEQSSTTIFDNGRTYAGNETTFGQPPGSQSSAAMLALAQDLNPSQGTQYAVDVTLVPQDQGPPVYSGGEAVGFFGAVPVLPAKLTSAVLNEWQNRGIGGAPQYPQSEWVSMPLGSSARPEPGLLIGAPFGSVYELYYFFPLAAEQQTIASIQQSLLVAGIAVVFLLAAIAWLVTRWVVVPVRLAAQGARRLSAGELDQRMEVRGSDEVAALAASFNEMAASLQEKLAELEDLSQVQRQFVSDVSHELRTPLTTIKIASDVLFGARDEMGPAPARSAELMQSQLERFEVLLTDLLEISRYDANAATLDAEPVDICGIVLQSADVAQQLAERRGTKIEFRVPAEPCIAEIDRRRVERIMRNLLLNAVEHGEDKDTVVTVAVDSAAVAVSVRDFGVGLRPGEAQLVFDRFWRADPARARTSGGTGLGLAIALEDARLHGGWLEAWGEPGRGSVFRLTLPRTAGAELHGSPLPLSPLPLGTLEDGIDATAGPVVDGLGDRVPAADAAVVTMADLVGPAAADVAAPGSADLAGPGAASGPGAIEPDADQPESTEVGARG
ncbi:MAG TPA: MtrAB system histidine kinase MtrB [Streptosporangiaceae bacterium]|nr:MtrAB system histidine kinase MtrB [Streptosporangiaceae bacterium]